MERVLLTGATGFVGAATAIHLRKLGFDVHEAGRSGSSSAARSVHRLDLLRDDPADVIRAIAPTHLMHLAWHGDRATIWHSPDNLAWVAATLRLLLAFRICGGRRAVVAGSAAEYDWARETLDDEHPVLAPATIYGKAKRAVFDLANSGALSPVSIGYARIFFPFGPDDKPDRLLSQVIDGVAAGRTVHCSTGRQVRPFIHVDDVGAALALLLASEVEGAVNIALDELCSVRDLALHAAGLAGDASLVRFGSRDLQPWEPCRLRATTRRLMAELGFRPIYTIADGVAATVRDRLARSTPEDGERAGARSPIPWEGGEPACPR